MARVIDGGSTRLTTRGTLIKTFHGEMDMWVSDGQIRPPSRASRSCPPGDDLTSRHTSVRPFSHQDVMEDITRRAAVIASPVNLSFFVFLWLKMEFGDS